MPQVCGRPAARVVKVKGYLDVQGAVEPPGLPMLVLCANTQAKLSVAFSCWFEERLSLLLLHLLLHMHGLPCTSCQALGQLVAAASFFTLEFWTARSVSMPQCALVLPASSKCHCCSKFGSLAGMLRFCAAFQPAAPSSSWRPCCCRQDRGCGIERGCVGA